MTSNPRHHHVVSASYLERFTDSSGFLHVYDRTEDKKTRQRPDNVMHQRDYYRQEWVPKGVDPNIFEKELGKWLENSAKNTIDQLISDSPNLSEQQGSEFLLYLELQRIKVPRQSVMATTLMLDTIMKSAPPDLTDAVRTGKIQLTINKSARFHYMRMMLKQLIPWFAAMEWEIVTADEESSFITTDSPVSLFNVACRPPEEPGMALAGTKVLFPLSSKQLLILQHPHHLRSRPPLEVLPHPGEMEDHLHRIDRGRVWNKKLVTRHNHAMFRLAHRWIVGSSLEQLEECIFQLSQPTTTT